MAQIKFYTGSTSSWKALNPANGGQGYDDSAIYFLSDSHQLCKGGNVLAKSFEVVTALPAVDHAKENVLYIVTSDRKLCTFNGVSFDDKLFIDPEIASSVSANETKAVSGKAVYDFVAEQIADLIGGSVDAYVTGVATKEGENGVLVISKGSNNSTEVRLTGVVIDPSYDSTTRTITLPKVDGTDLVINLGKDMVVQSGRYDAENKKIILVLNDTEATEIQIDATGLVDVYETGSAETDPVKVVVSNHKISTTVTVDNEIIKIVDGKITADLSKYALASVVEGLEDRIEAVETAINDTTSGLSVKVNALEARINTAESTMADNLAEAKSYTDSQITALSTTCSDAREALKTDLEGKINVVNSNIATSISAALNWNSL